MLTPSEVLGKNAISSVESPSGAAAFRERVVDGHLTVAAGGGALIGA
jgi:hypothetical protein